MMSDNENEKCETLADIVAEMKRTKYGDEDCSVKWCLREWADRIEEAWKRERDRLMTEPRSWEECVARAMKAKENSDVLY